MHPRSLRGTILLGLINSMNAIHESRPGPAAWKREAAFTLIELPIVIAIIAVLIGLLLPAVQRTREINNQTGAQADLHQIYLAEKAYYKANTAYTTSLATLGLSSKFPNNMADGYAFTITDAVSEYTVSGLPYAPGLNGSVDFSMDQSGKISSSPDPDATPQHEKTTEDIQDQAMQVIVQAIADADSAQTDMPAIEKALGSPTVISNAFSQVATNDKLTVSDILNYSGLGSAEMAPLLTAIQNDFQFGTGAENTGKISLTLRQAMGDGSAGSISGNIVVAEGLSSETIAVGGPTQAQFAGSCTGSINAGTALSLRNPDLFSTVTLYQAQSGGGAAWSGPITLSDIYGNATGGFVVGELVPAVQIGGAGGTGQQLEAIVIGLNATSVMSGGAGFGSMKLKFTALGDEITGSLKVAAPQ